MTCEHLKKAKAALAAARIADDGDASNRKRVQHLLDIAQVQAAVSQAESLAEIAKHLTRYSLGHVSGAGPR